MSDCGPCSRREDSLLKAERWVYFFIFNLLTVPVTCATATYHTLFLCWFAYLDCVAPFLVCLELVLHVLMWSQTGPVRLGSCISKCQLELLRQSSPVVKTIELKIHLFFCELLIPFQKQLHYERTQNNF